MVEFQWFFIALSVLRDMNDTLSYSLQNSQVYAKCNILNAEHYQYRHTKKADTDREASHTHTTDKVRNAQQLQSSQNYNSVSAFCHLTVDLCSQNILMPLFRPNGNI